MAKFTKAQLRSINVEHIAPNQTIINVGDSQILQSYNSVVAIKTGNTVELSPDWEYSKTTMKFVKQFLDSPAAETRKKIASKEWKINPEL